jgi:hypothetical protein
MGRQPLAELAAPRAHHTDAGGTDERNAGEDLAPVKARTLLILALTRIQDPQEVQRILSKC